MRIFICTMEDPVYTLPFIRRIIEGRPGEIVGVAVARGDRLTLRRNRSQAAYVLSLLLIMGPTAFARNAFTTLAFKARLFLAERTRRVQSPSILAFAAARGIPTFRVDNVNDPAFLDVLRGLAPDVVINQAQQILKREFLAIPRLGVLNRHNALLPKNRGRLTPFWVAYREEPETGVSIHYVTEELDAGDIVVQERFPVTRRDDFNTIAAMNYRIAPGAMLEALDRLERGTFEPIPNPADGATYNSTPTLKDAARYRLNRIRSVLR